MGEVGPEPLGVEAGFVHADKTDGGEVVVEGAQVALRVRVEALVKKLADDGSLNLQGPCRNVHQVVEALIEVLFVGGQVSDSRKIDGDYADTSCRLTGTEVATGLLAELPQVQTEPAAHGADIGGLHVGVDVI